MKPLVILLSAIAIAAGVYILVERSSNTTNPDSGMTQDTDAQPAAIVRTDPTFEWVYEESDRNPEIPSTTISLTARYAEGTSETKVIDTIEGGCNEYLEPDADVYEKSEMIICYYAGLGHYFKVVEADGQYLVQRKVFEEGSPDYEPVVQDFETVAVF